MTAPVLKIRVLQRPLIKGKMNVRFPANVDGDAFITVEKANGTYTFIPDYTILDPTPFLDPAATYVAVWDAGSQSWKVTTLSVLISGTTGIVQHITDPGPADILPNAGIVLVDQTVGAAITLNMPLASVKTCPVLISDWKGDAGTNNITIAMAGSDELPGGLTSWVIGGDTGSIFLRPASGFGYTL